MWDLCGVHEEAGNLKGLWRIQNLGIRESGRQGYGYPGQSRLYEPGRVYVWLSSRLNLPYEETHIGYFSDYLCEQTILECEQVLDNWKANHEKRAA